jgi:hypothetical protein
MSLGKPTIKLCFMDDEMRDFAVNEATKALETSNSEKVFTPSSTHSLYSWLLHT